MPKQRACLIVNANSSGSASDLSRGMDLLSRAGLELEVVRTREPDDVSRVIDERRGKIDLVIIGGGDGSLNCAAAPIRAAKLPFGILPLGTANDLARTLGVPADVEGACRVIAEGFQTWIDLGTVNGKPFFNAASVGTAVHLSHGLDGETKRRWGVLSYPLALLEVLRDPPTFHVDILHDGQRAHVKAMQVTVGNGRFYGGGMVVHKEATIDDGRLDLYALKPHGIWRLITASPLLRWGMHERWEGSLHINSQKIEIQTNRPMDVSADGEVVTTTPATFLIKPKALAVFTPAS